MVGNVGMAWDGEHGMVQRPPRAPSGPEASPVQRDTALHGVLKRMVCLTLLIVVTLCVRAGSWRELQLQRAVFIGSQGVSARVVNEQAVARGAAAPPGDASLAADPGYPALLAADPVPTATATTPARSETLGERGSGSGTSSEDGDAMASEEASPGAPPEHVMRTHAGQGGVEIYAAAEESGGGARRPRADDPTAAKVQLDSSEEEEGGVAKDGGGGGGSRASHGAAVRGAAATTDTATPDRAHAGSESVGGGGGGTANSAEEEEADGSIESDAEADADAGARVEAGVGISGITS